MTTVCLKAKSSVKTEIWSSVFNNFNTDAKSCLFMKHLTKTCISAVLFLRKVLPEEFFETKSFEGMTLKLLKSRPGDNYIMTIQQWLEGAFEAIEKKYLKRLMLDIQDAESNKILEVYTMSYSYRNEKDSLSLPAVSDIKLNTIKLLQMCHAVTQSYRSLPSKVNLDIRLSYYKNTPDGYQPNGYEAWEHMNLDFPNQARSIEIGVTSTQHHIFKFFNKSALNDKFLKNMEDELKNTACKAGTKSDDSQESKIQELRKTKAKRELCFNISNNILDTNSSISSKPKEKAEVFVVSEKIPSICRKTDTEKIKLSKSRNSYTSDLKNQTLRCPCLSSKKSESMFSCSNCGFLIHAECFGILQFDPSKKIRFYCHLCHQNESTRICHDKILISLKSSSDQQKLSLLRRILKYCNMPSIHKITVKKMEKITGLDGQNNIINIVLKKMIEIGVVIPQWKKKNYLIDKNKLESKLMIYFYKVQNSDQITKQTLHYSLRSSALKRHDEKGELHGNKKNKKLTPVLQERLTDSQTPTQFSHDIFS